jgi:nucleoside-diphosphate-sugar epimerase
LKVNEHNKKGTIISTITVTGGTGFVGSHIVELLLRCNQNVKCIIRPGRKSLGWLEGTSAEILYTDLNDFHSIKTIMNESDYFIHIAGVTKAKKHSEYYDGNVKPLFTLLEAAEQSPHLKKFCYVSSQAAIGPNKNCEFLNEDAPFNPITPYGESKAEAEKICAEYFSKIPLVIVRPPAVYGPRDTDFLEVIKTVKSGISAEIGSKDKFVSMIYVEDLARGIILATLSENTRGKIYFITDETPRSSKELNQTIADLLNKKPLHIRIPEWLFYIISAFVQFAYIFSKKPSILNLSRAKEFIQPYWLCTGKRFHQDTGFKIQMSLREGLAKTIEWYKLNKWL